LSDASKTMTATVLFSRLNITSDLHPGYRLVRLRGAGGFGEVWEAEKSDGSSVALKFLPCTGARGGANLELRSIQVVRDLPHRHLIEIERVWCAGAYLIVAMELADGSLADLYDIYLAEDRTGMPAAHLLPLMEQAAKALDFMNIEPHVINDQRVNVQHCDVNPNNILIFGDIVKLSDFSLTTMLTGPKKDHRRAGTTAYAAPEVFQGSLTNRTDQYALAVCYCRLRGSLPFADSPSTFLTTYCRPQPNLSVLTPGEQPAINRALSPVPEDRWPSCRDMIKELCKQTGTPRAASSPYLRRQRVSKS
jgi:serine/threonine protein kinase, bacterial